MKHDEFEAMKDHFHKDLLAVAGRFNQKIDNLQKQVAAQDKEIVKLQDAVVKLQAAHDRDNKSDRKLFKRVDNLEEDVVQLRHAINKLADVVMKFHEGEDEYGSSDVIWHTPAEEL